MNLDKNSDWNIPTTYFEDEKEHWNNLLTQEDIFNIGKDNFKQSLKKGKKLKLQIPLAMLILCIMAAGWYFSNDWSVSNSSEIANQTIKNEQFKLSHESQNIQAMQETPKVVSENKDSEKKYTGDSVKGPLNSKEDSLNLKKDIQIQKDVELNVMQELATLSSDEIQAYLMEENSDVLIETIY
jgi:hypothetical protein